MQSAADARDTMDSSKRWITLAFTWNGLRALGVADDALASFPDEFREGMAARADILGDTGASAPQHWVGGLAGEDLHAIAILFARDDEEHRRCIGEHDKLVARCAGGAQSLSYLDLNATPPFNYAHDHFGFRDRLSQPVMKGSGEEPTPGSGAALEPGEFILGYPDEDGPVANLPQPEVLSRNGSYMAYRRLQEHVGAFRDYLGANADTPAGQELLAAKFMGRWRSGAPLVLAPDADDPELGADPMRNNDFNYKRDGPARLRLPAGIACPAAQSARHRPLHEPPPDDPPRRHLRSGPARRRTRRRGRPRHRRVHHLREPGAPVRVRPERVDQRQDVPRTRQRTRSDLRQSQDGTLDFTVPKRPIRKVHKGIPAFTTLTGGAYFFLPGLAALRYLATLTSRKHHDRTSAGPHVQPGSRRPTHVTAGAA